MDATSTITVADAYRAMFVFITAYWERGGRTDEIGSMLGDVQYGISGPTEPADPAQWQDWLDAVARVTQ